jgi:hypothetical protein
MPFLEILVPDPLWPALHDAAPALTGALVRAWGISPDIVTTYLCRVPGDAYLHAGKLNPETTRIFVKLHAFRRSAQARADAAAALTETLVAAGLRPGDVIIYFMDRAPDEVAHAGHLQSATP